MGRQISHHQSVLEAQLGVDHSFKSNQSLQQIVSHLSSLTQGTGQRLIAIDSNVPTAHGESMQGARIGYNPHKPGRPSYHPILAVDINGRSVVDGYLRPGSAGTGNGLVGFIKKLAAEKKGKDQDMVFRLDKGLTSGPALDAIEEQGCGYVAKHKLTSRLMA